MQNPTESLPAEALSAPTELFTVVQDERALVRKIRANKRRLARALDPGPPNPPGSRQACTSTTQIGLADDNGTHVGMLRLVSFETEFWDGGVSD
jgi:hypothetical protein